MNSLLDEFITGLNFGEDQVLGRLRIKPLINTNSNYARAVPLKTLDEAISDNLLQITEINTGGSVPELLVKNLGKSDIIILEGETVIGGKQNWSVNSTFIIPANGEVVVPVSCVEAGRWSYVSDTFSSGRSVVYPSLRAMSHSAVSRNLRAYQEYRSDQRGIWSDISHKGRRMSVRSDTCAMSDIENSTLGPEAESDLLDRIQYQENQVGFLAFVDGGFAGGDIFGTPDLCEKQFAKLLKGYYLDALDRVLVFPELTPGEIMDEIAESDEVRFEALGRGEENRFETARLTGAWKSVDGGLATITVFPRSDQSRFDGFRMSHADVFRSLLEIGRTGNFEAISNLAGAGNHKYVCDFTDYYLRVVRRQTVSLLSSDDLSGLIKAVAVYEDSVGGLGSVTVLHWLFQLHQKDHDEVLDWVLSNTRSYRHYSYGASSLDDLNEIKRGRAALWEANEQREQERETEAKKRKADEATGNLYNAVRRGDVKAVQALLNKGARPNGTTPSGEPLAIFAENLGRSDIASILRRDAH